MGFKTATELIEELDGRSASALGQSSSTGDDALGGVVFMCRYARASDASARAKFARRATAASLRCSSRFRGAICGTTACSRDALLGDCGSARSYHRLGTIRRARSVFPRHNHLDPPRPDSQIARSPNSPTFFTSLPQRRDLRRHDAERPLRPDPAVMVVRQGHPTGDAVIPL